MCVRVHKYGAGAAKKIGGVLPKSWKITVLIGELEIDSYHILSDGFSKHSHQSTRLSYIFNTNVGNVYLVHIIVVFFLIYSKWPYQHSDKYRPVLASIFVPRFWIPCQDVCIKLSDFLK